MIIVCESQHVPSPEPLPLSASSPEPWTFDLTARCTAVEGDELSEDDAHGHARRGAHIQ